MVNVAVAGGSLTWIEFEAECGELRAWILRIRTRRRLTQMVVDVSVPPSTAHAVRAFDQTSLQLEQVVEYRNLPIPPSVDQVLVTG